MLARHYGAFDAIGTLTAERDENFRVTRADGDFVLKIFAPGTPMAEAEMLCAVLGHLERCAPELPVPRLARSVDGADVVRLPPAQGRERLAVLYSFLPGRPLMDAARSIGQARACGGLLARLGLALHDFAHPAMHRALIWDLRRLPDLLPIAAQLREVPFAGFVLPFLERFTCEVLPALDRLPRQFVHNDLNARNVIVASDNQDRIAGIIDFGDAVHTARICDVAVGVIGQLAAPHSADAMMQAFVESYHQQAPLSDQERALLPWLVAGRVVQNITMIAHYREGSEESGHFAGFGADYFGWRVAFSQRLIAG